MDSETKKSFVQGRIRRKTYWSFAIWGYIIVAIPAFLFSQYSDGYAHFTGFEMIVFWVFAIIVFIIEMCFIFLLFIKTVQRLHDVGSSGWYYFISLIPFVGGILFFFALVTDSEPYTNQYGPDPKYYER
jgi:uncharacterized membrane protein YhaH (DUF805 family)